MRLLALAGLLFLATALAGCACVNDPLGPRTLPTGEDKYSAKYD